MRYSGNVLSSKIDETDKPIQLKLVFLMFSFIYLSDALLFVYNSNHFLTTFAQYALVILAMLFLGTYLFTRHYPFNRSFTFMLLICVWLFIAALVHDELRGGYVSKISLFILGYTMFQVIHPDELIKAYKKCMDVICASSVIVVAFSAIISRLMFLPMITSILNRRHIFLVFTNCSLSDPMRNYGPFTEPSRFQAFIMVALIFELFNRIEDNNIRWNRVILYSVTIVTTFSTTAFLAIAIVMIAYFMSFEVNLSLPKRLALILLMIMIVYLLTNYSEGVIKALTKLEMGEKSESYTVRVNSIIGGIRVALRNPVFGSGFTNYEREYLNAISDLSASRSHVSTNTFILYFSKFGFVIGAYYLINMYHMVHSFTKTYTAVILLVGLFLCTSGISLVDSIIFSAIIFYRKERSEAGCYHENPGSYRPRTY